MEMKRLFVVLAVGLLVGAGIGVAQAQSAGTPSGPYNGAIGNNVPYPPNYNGFRDTNGFIPNPAGGYVGYPNDYTNPPNTSAWTHNAPVGGYTGYPTDYTNKPNTNGWIHLRD
jgi:hypothetical protein